MSAPANGGENRKFAKINLEELIAESMLRELKEIGFDQAYGEAGWALTDANRRTPHANSDEARLQCFFLDRLQFTEGTCVLREVIGSGEAMSDLS